MPPRYVMVCQILNFLTKEYFKKWFWQVGQTLGHEIQWKWFYAFTIAPVWVWKEWFKSLFRLVKFQTHPSVQESERFAAQVWIFHSSGMLSERFVHWISFLGINKCIFSRGGK